jgi:hypothetical protein
MICPLCDEDLGDDLSIVRNADNSWHKHVPNDEVRSLWDESVKK